MASESTIAPHARIEVNPEHLVAELDGDVVIMSMGTGTYYGLDTVGAYVWKLLGQPRTFASIVEAVLEQFEAGPAEVESDLSAFLLEMQSEGIVSITPADAEQPA